LLYDLNAKAFPQLARLTDEQWQEACRREAVIRPLAEQDATSRQAAAAAVEQLGIGPALVYRLVARFRARPQTSSLAPGVRGNRATWLPKNPFKGRKAFCICSTT
jgi:hypothetical protein